MPGVDKEHTTHYACNKRMRQEGGKARCCYESNHSHCEFRKPQKKKEPNAQSHRVSR